MKRVGALDCSEDAMAFGIAVLFFRLRRSFERCPEFPTCEVPGPKALRGPRLRAETGRGEDGLCPGTRAR